MDAANKAWMRRFQQTSLLTTDEVVERLKRPQHCKDLDENRTSPIR
ncbi:MAG: hypothetical protein ACI94Y_003314 [Maribacter sp.]|jgi:hypothetical protein